MKIRTSGCLFLLVLFITSVLCRRRGGSRRHAHKYVKTGTKRNVKNWDEAIMAFREMVIRQILESGIDLPTKPSGSATTWLLSILENKQWDTLEQEMNKHIAEKTVDDSLKHVISTEFDQLMQIMEKAKNNSFKRSDMAVIRGAWQNFFPQSYSPIGFSVKWLDAVTKYLTILAAGYIDLMKAGEFEECKFAEQLNVLKSAIIEAAKKLAVARYKRIGKINWDGGSKKYETAATLSFWDGASGKLYEDIPLSQLQGTVFTPLKLEMANLMMARMGDKFHALYNSSWAGTSCTLVDKIALEDFEIPYPTQCMDADAICIFPCGYYMEPKPWCVVKLKNNKWQTGKKQKNWDECQLPDWDKCTFVKKLKPIRWPDANEKPNGSNKKYEVSQVEDDTINNNKNATNTTVLIYEGINTITSLLCAEHCDERDALKEDEKIELNDLISGKVKTFLSRRTIERANGSHDGGNTTSSTKANVLDSGVSRVVEALIIKAVLDKKRYGNITTYLDGLRKWEMTSDYIKGIKSKIKEVKNNTTEKREYNPYLVNLEDVRP